MSAWEATLGGAFIRKGALIGRRALNQVITAIQRHLKSGGVIV